MGGGRVRLHLGDCIHAMRSMPEQSVEAAVTDPPYDLLQASRRGSARSNEPANPFGRHGSRGGFMGMAWDATGIAFDPATWSEVLRVVKPGGHLIAFGGTRTWHRMTCAIEDAGFEIRDCLMWLYGSGFPKSLDVGRALAPLPRSSRADEAAWDGWGTGLKPAWEPIVLARRPLAARSVAANVRRFGTGAINVDGCRIAFGSSADEDEARTKNRHAAFRSGSRANRVYSIDRRARTDYMAPGRWPANLLLSHPGGCAGETCAPGCPVAELDGQSGIRRSRRGRPRSSASSPLGYRMTRTGTEHDDSGGASRFFYAAKASTAERNHGLERLACLAGGSSGDVGSDRLHSADSCSEGRNTHPCVKPLALMTYLCRLVTPPGGVVLDPFMGSASTGVAAVAEGLAFVGIEGQPAYFEIARARMRKALVDARTADALAA
jgi:site-specific DNA-methyltransferase (adenine-specific)